MDLWDGKLYRTLSRLKRGELIVPLQRRLNDTERKPLVTQGVMSSTVQNLTQLKIWIGIMAIVLYSCYRSNRFISQLEYSSVEYQMYGHQASLRRGLLTSPVIKVQYLYSDFRAHKWPSEHQREGMGTIEYWHRMSCIIKCWSREECKFYFPAAVFCSGSHLSGPPWHHPSPPAKMIKTPIRVNPLVYSLCAE